MILLFTVAGFAQPAATTSTTTQAKENSAAPKGGRLEELLLWKLSDEMKLGAADEKKFTDTIRDLNLKKAKLSAQLEAQYKSLQATMDAKKRTQVLNEYRKTMDSLQKVPLEEWDRLKKILGEEKLVLYLQTKQDLVNKVRSLFVEKAEKTVDEKPLPPPKIIEETSTK